MRSKEREEWMRLVELERAAHRAEVHQLLGRIQHPEVVPTPQMPPYEPVEPPRDAAEMAWVGEQVPDFVDVGSPREEPDA